ncbi:transcriptional regulator, RpiR family protein [Planococcus donghaensis MPA1U2]|uniref:Transcriptional regulator, RpiR family protein n=1 Tax=Planococcus donghaensis MPA1U2 TaxID=933115 RepID=E7RCR2_9BACL|nr:MurR/RpiR family transcriptional regulator [Planococcus donghaensis]EGA91427.1 transcriptional regulator, RpiR family protein [Planococcus donghaensis MPA1U2]
MKTQTKLVGVKPTLLMAQMKADFTKSDTKVYEYIVENKDQVLYHSLTEMAEACDVAEATLLRFFRKLDYKGFQDFKFMLAQEISSTVPDTTEDTYIDKVKNNVIQVISDTSDVVSEELLDQAIMKIAEAEDVVIFGIGSSGIAALDMQNRLMRIGKNASVITDSHFQMMRAASMTKNTVVIAVSLTGSTKDIVDAVSASKASGATVIALTSYTKSPLTKFADLVLLSSSKESPLDSGSLVSKISQLFLIDLICTGLAMKNVKEAKAVQLKISENTSSKLY